VANVSAASYWSTENSGRNGNQSEIRTEKPFDRYLISSYSGEGQRQNGAGRSQQSQRFHWVLLLEREPNNQNFSQNYSDPAELAMSAR
jgi:hypothetical protein